MASARDRFLELLRTAVLDGTLVKLTLGKHRGSDPTLRNLFVRPITLKAGPHLTFVWRHATRDVTKNHPPAEALELLTGLVGRDFLDAHLFTPLHTAQFEGGATDSEGRLTVKQATTAPGGAEGHDRSKAHVVDPGSPWLQALGVTNPQGRPREGMAAKYRQIQKFVELLQSLAKDAGFDDQRAISIADMGCGKGYLTFATAAAFGPRAQVLGIEVRPELVELCNRVAHDSGLAQLRFIAGDIAGAVLPKLDVLIALHACDTATDDALAKGLSANASLLVVSPCCQKEVRPQLTAPPVLAEALKHGIFQERQAEFATDALRAQLLEWAGYRTKVFEFVSTEHTARNLMIAAVRSHAPGNEERARKIREFAAFYGIRRQKLATHLGFDLVGNA